MIKVSVGTADVLGLKQLKSDAPPTTAYLLSGDKCQHDCSFCAQARNSTGRADMLSRVIWPDYQIDSVTKGIREAFSKELLKRTCLQVVNKKDALSKAERLMAEIKREADIAICVSCNLSKPEEAIRLVEMGADKIGLSLDAACERVYKEAKGDSWDKRLELIEKTAQLLPGKISTHLIVGLGETEEEMVATMAHMVNIGVTIGLFAFTPVKGTRYADRKPPELAHYRRMQAAQYLLEKKLAKKENFKFEQGFLIDFGFTNRELINILATGEAFQTSGCPDCNRPYYNEKPGGNMYNYPRELLPSEITAAFNNLGLLEDSCKCSGD